MIEMQNTGQTQLSGKRASNLSKDGQWRSFPKVPNLLQYVSSGMYFARTKTHGKLIRQSLKTDVWTTAKLRLVDFSSFVTIHKLAILERLGASA